MAVAEAVDVAEVVVEEMVSAASRGLGQKTVARNKIIANIAREMFGTLPKTADQSALCAMASTLAAPARRKNKILTHNKGNCFSNLEKSRNGV